MATHFKYADHATLQSEPTRRYEDPKRKHLLQFHEDDRYLLDAVARWLVHGFREREICVVISTDIRRRGIEKRLTSAGLDLEAIRRGRRLVWFDASAIVSRFTLDDCPDRSRFSEMLRSLITETTERPAFRVYSEMAVVLWTQGKRPAAVRLEELWSDFIRNQPAQVFCAFPVRSFDSDSDDFWFTRICSVHSHVIPAENYMALDNPADRLRLISTLQHKARLLESEKTALHEAASHLAFCQQRLCDFINNSAEGMHRIDPHGRINFANPAQLRLLGYTQAEFVGHNLSEFHLDPGCYEEFLRRLMRHEVVCDFPAALRAKDGSTKHFRIQAVGHWKNERFAYARCFLRDMTECVELESRLRFKNGELAEADRHKNNLLAMLGHELRNPVAAVLNATITAQLNSSYRERALDIARRQIDQLARLVDDLLDAERVKAGRIGLDHREICIDELIGNCISDCADLLRGSDVEVLISPQAAIACIEGDRERLQQVIGNLIQNAVKFSPPKRRIQIAADLADREATIKVRDFGFGISEDLLPHIFELFVQGDCSLDRKNGGLGIGLTLVKRLVEMHGGYVTASSAGLGHGSEFTIHLPVLTDGHTQRSRKEIPMTSQSARILVVEDNSDAAEALTMLLETFGHHTTVVPEGNAAVEAVRDGDFTLGLVDIGLPGMDGYEVARRIRALPNGLRVTLVALTGYGQDSDKQAALNAGFNQHLTKPVNIDALRALLASL